MNFEGIQSIAMDSLKYAYICNQMQLHALLYIHNQKVRLHEMLHIDQKPGINKTVIKDHSLPMSSFTR